MADPTTDQIRGMETYAFEDDVLTIRPDGEGDSLAAPVHIRYSFGAVKSYDRAEPVAFMYTDLARIDPTTAAAFLYHFAVREEDDGTPGTSPLFTKEVDAFLALKSVRLGRVAAAILKTYTHLAGEMGYSVGGPDAPDAEDEGAEGKEPAAPPEAAQT